MKNKVYSLLFILGLIFSVITAAVPMSVYDKGFFMSEAKENEVSEHTGLSENEISEVTDEIFLYLQGARSDFDIVVNREGKNMHLFNEDEQKHMVDVQNLMTFSRVVLILSTILTLVFGTALYRQNRKLFYMDFLISGIIGMILLILAGIIASGDFTAIFVKCHQIIFSNELWLMDPDTEVLINIVPEPYFIHLALYAGGLIAAGDVMSIMTGLLGKKSYMKAL